MAEQLNRDRLNELLGIQEGQTFDDYMDEVGSDVSAVQSQANQLISDTRDRLGEIDQQVRQDVQTIDAAQSQLSCSDENGTATSRIDALVNVEGAFKSIEDLVDTTKQMIGTVYSIISSCDVLDSETVGAAASLIGETRQLISEYTGLYKQRLKFFDQVKMETLKQRNRLELLRAKYELDSQKWREQHPNAEAEVVDPSSGQAVPPGMVSIGTNDMLRMLQEVNDGSSNPDRMVLDQLSDEPPCN